MRAPRNSRSLQRGWWQIAAAAALDALGKDSSRKQAHEQMDAQREFAQMGIRWKVADAKAAGIHPLYAIGAQGASYSPVINAGGSGFDNTFAAMGQHFDRAQRVNESQGDRLGAFMQQQDQLATTRRLNTMLAEEQIAGERQRNLGQQLDNEAKRLLLQKTIREMGPPGPSTGSAPFGAIKVEPSEQISGDRALPGREAAPTPGFKTYRYGNRSIDLPNEALSESLEGQGAMGHILAPIMFGQHYWDKWGVSDWFSGPPPKGYKRVFDPRRREVVIVPK